MNIEKAKEILGGRATWELKQIKKALTLFEGIPFLQSEEEDQRLEAAKTLLKANGR